MNAFRHVRNLARPLGLAVLLMLPAGLAQAASVDFYIHIEGVDGESASSTPAESFDIRLVGEGPQAALLVPAVQKVREAAARINLERLACNGALIPLMVVESFSAGRVPYFKYELKNVLVTSYQVGASEGRPHEELSLNYEEVKVTNLETGEVQTYDCSTGRCSCSR